MEDSRKEPINFIYKYVSPALICMLALELIFLIYCNLFRLSDVIDVDFARVLRHMTEMADRRRLFLPYWDYITTAELDHSALLAMPLYMLTGNVMLSYGIANLINIALWCLVLHRLLGMIPLSKECRLLAWVLIFTIFDMGMLSYTNMLFFGAEHYTHKVLLPVMFVTLILTGTKDRRKPLSIFLYIVFYALLLVTGISSGIYVFICGILPVIAYLVIERILMGGAVDTRYRLLLGTSAVADTVLGLLICRMGGVRPNSELAMIKSMDTVRGNLFSTFLDLMELYRVFPGKSVSVMSLSSVMTVLRIFIFIVILVCGLRCVGRIWVTGSPDGVQTPGACAEQLLITIFVWNYFILFVSGSQQRYHLIGAIPLMICAVICMDGLKDRRAGLLKVSLTAAVIVLDLYQIIWGSRQYLHNEDYSKAVNAAVIAYMEDNDVDTAFSLYESGYGMEWLRIADRTRSYETFIPASGEVVSYDFYYTGRDRSAYSDRNILIATEEEYDSCPGYIKDNYMLSGSACNYNIYLSEYNPIDGIAGMLEGVDTTDLVTAPGYEKHGIIDARGYLDTDYDGAVLISPVIDIVTPCTWTLEYSVEEDTDVRVEIYTEDEYGSDGSPMAVYSPDTDKGKVRHVFPRDGEYRIVVLRSGEGLLQIKEMRYTGEE